MCFRWIKAILWPSRRIKNSEEFSAVVEGLIYRLADAGFKEESGQLYRIVHEMVWTTGTELIVEIGSTLRSIRKQKWGVLPKQIQDDILACEIYIGLTLRKV